MFAGASTLNARLLTFLANRRATWWAAAAFGVVVQ
jgi:hypothetical protein